MKKTIINPLLALAGCFAAFNGTSTLQAQTTNIWNFNYTGSIVQWTVPISGYYDVTAYGAQGGGWTGANRFYAGGRGTTIGGRFQFDQGEVLNILVGGTGQASQEPYYGFHLGGGGGGGSVVWYMMQNFTSLGAGDIINRQRAMGGADRTKTPEVREFLNRF
jgi:hypothetical protein